MWKSRAPEHYTKRIRALIKSNPWAWARRGRQIRGIRKILGYTDWRRLDDYLADFDRFFPGKGLLNALAEMHKKRPLRILDDGAGKGHALGRLKWELAGLGIPCETTAMTLRNPPSELLDAKRRGLIDHIVEGHAEFFVPKKSFDLIMSYIGSISYTHPLARKDLLLKFAHSLSKNGIMLVAFAIDVTKPELFALDFGKTIPNAASLPISEREKIKDFIRMRVEGIARALEKRGFEAEFVLQGNEGMPFSLLCIRRK